MKKDEEAVPADDETVYTPIFKLTEIARITQSPYGKAQFHQAVMSEIGVDYQTTHWNEKGAGVHYEYRDDNGTKFELYIEATPIEQQ